MRQFPQETHRVPRDWSGPYLLGLRRDYRRGMRTRYAAGEPAWLSLQDRKLASRRIQNPDTRLPRLSASARVSSFHEIAARHAPRASDAKPVRCEAAALPSKQLRLGSDCAVTGAIPLGEDITQPDVPGCSQKV